jgi:pimeloyl-ACP methyl ester carboxylesterase
MHKKLKNSIKVLGIALLVYLCLSVGAYVFQYKIIFQSKSLPKEFVFSFDQKFQEYFIPAEDGKRLNALLFKTDQLSKGLILYFHGNAGNLKRWGSYAVDFTKLGYDILMVDYRGYGKSNGKPTEEDLYTDAFTVWNWSKVNAPHDKIIIYGRSLGSAVASKLATKTNPDLLILETPFDELKGVVYPPFRTIFYLLPTQFHFPNNLFLAEVKCRKVIIHGTNDWVVPLSSASRLKQFISTQDAFVVIDGGSHNNLRDFPLYHTTLKNVLESLE